MNCREFDENADAFLDGELDEKAIREMDSHVSGCEDCGARLDELRRASATFREQMEATAPASMDRAVMAAFREKHGVAAEKASLWNLITGKISLPRWAFAAALLLAGAVGVSAYWIGRSSVSQMDIADKNPPSINPTESVSQNKLTPSGQGEDPAPPENDALAIKTVRVPYYKDRVVTRYVVRERVVTRHAPNPSRSQDAPEVSIVEKDVKAANQTTETDLKGFESVPEIKATIIKKGDEDEKEK